MYALPRNGSSCHNVNWWSWKWENTHPDPFNLNTSMKCSSWRLTSSSGDAAPAAYTAIISEVMVTGGCDNAWVHRFVTHNRDGNLKLVGMVFVLVCLHCW